MFKRWRRARIAGAGELLHQAHQPVLTQVSSDTQLLLSFFYDVSKSMGMSGLVRPLSIERDRQLQLMRRAWLAAGGRKENLLVREAAFSQDSSALSREAWFNEQQHKMPLFRPIDDSFRENFETAYHRHCHSGSRIRHWLCEGIEDLGELLQLLSSKGRKVAGAVIMITDDSDYNNSRSLSETYQRVQEAQARGIKVIFCRLGGQQQHAREEAQSMGINEGTRYFGKADAAGASGAMRSVTSSLFGEQYSDGL